MWSITLILSFILVSIVTAIYGYFKYAFRYWKLKGVPSDDPVIPYGSVKELGKTLHLSEITKMLYEKYKPTGAKICGAYMLTRPIAIVLDLEVIRNIFVKDFAYFSERGLYYNERDDPLTSNMLTLNGEKWKILRLKMTPLFTSAKIKCMFPLITGIADRFRDSLFDLSTKTDEIEIGELCARFTTDIIGTCAFGIECNSLNDPNAAFRVYSHRLLTQPKFKALAVQLLNDFEDVGRALRIKMFNDDVSDFFIKITNETVEYREKNNIKRNDFMDMLIELKNQGDTDDGKALTLNELYAQAFIFFMAGFETSSTTLTYCLYELAMNQDIQSKARHAVQEAYQKYNGEFTYEMSLDIPYIDQVLEETMRLHPPVAYLPRRAQMDYQVPGTDIVLEKGRRLLIPIHAIHTDPEYYPNPEIFDPQRFSNDEKKKRDNMTFIPFGSGPRNCLGLRFAMMQARIGLLTVLNNFEISISPTMNLPLTVCLTTFLLTPNECFLTLKPLKSYINNEVSS